MSVRPGACYRSLVHAWDRPPFDEARRPAAGVVVRDAKEADFEAIIAMWQELMELHTTADERFALADDAEDRFLGYLDAAQSRDDYRVRVAVFQGRPVGFTIACVLPNSPIYRARWVGYINDICVTASMRRRGVGELLVHDAVRWLRASGAESVEVYVAQTNEVAKRFWRRVGAREYLERLSLDGASGGRTR